MYVSADSSDVWAERDIFALDEKGNPLGVAGCPPDDFAKDGQIWGNPTFRWDVLKKRNYDWWMRRLERMMELYDYVRLDHFLGFSSFYNIPGGRGAMEGAWNFGPGIDLFRVAQERFGNLPFIGEDLGTITPAVRFLVATTGFPGMDVILFANEDVRYGYTPVPGKICYTSTHDTQTLLGWIKSKWPFDDSQHLYRELVAKCLGSNADVVIMPLQDILVLDDEARMNVPGTAEGNWSWKAQEDAVNAAQQYLASLARDAGRWRKQA
jgi:4-alpha-glucanotransferase